MAPRATALATPDLLRRNNSTKDLTEFAENAVAVNRLVLQHMAFSQGPTFRVRGRSLARGDEEERTSSFEEERASSTMAHLEITGCFMADPESGSPRLDMSALSIDVPAVIGGSSGNSPNGNSSAAPLDTIASSYMSTGSDDCYNEFGAAEEDEPGSSGSSGSSGFGSFYGTSVETVINARLGLGQRLQNVMAPGVDVVKASGVFGGTTSSFLDRGDGLGGGGLLMISSPSTNGQGGGHMSRGRQPRTNTVSNPFPNFAPLMGGDFLGAVPGGNSNLAQRRLDMTKKRLSVPDSTNGIAEVLQAGKS